MREISEMQSSPPEGIRIVTNEDNLLDVTGTIEGPGMHVPCAWPTRRVTYLPRYRGHTILRWLLQSKVYLYGRLPGSTAKM
jgi:hypothetical protein